MTRRTGTATLTAIVFCVTLALVATPVDVLSRDLAINEIAWGGGADYTGEWIELVNTSDAAIRLDGWRLASSDGAPNVLLGGILGPRSKDDEGAGYYLAERHDDGSVPSLPADVIYSGALTDQGETLYLYDPEGLLVDSANLSSIAESASVGWPAGTASRAGIASCSMERVDPLRSDTPENWATSTTRQGTGDPAFPCGTPKTENSAYNVLPSASMVIDPRFPQPGDLVHFDATSSTDLNDQIVSFAWDFGDGSTADGQTASHTFAAAGEYEIVLTARDSKGDSTNAVHALPVYTPATPVADFSILPQTVGAPLRAGDIVRFQDESSHGPAEITERRWEFDDGAIAEGECVPHEYASAGTYVVRLAVVDAQGSPAERSETVAVVSRAPTADFIVVTDHPSEGESTAFDASASSDSDGEVASFLWDFEGDGTTDMVTGEPRVEHTFEASGHFAPELIVEDADGDRSAPHGASIYINARPVTQFTLSTFEPEELEPVEFVDRSHDIDGTIRAWLWEFGDGETSVQTSPVHAFEESGPYTVTLTAVDDQSASRTVSAAIEVGNLLPVASFTVSPSEDQETGVPFLFDAEASTDPSPTGSIVSYEWDIDGDGVYDHETTSPAFSHSYSEDGAYAVILRITDDRGGAAESAPTEITVRNRPPSVRTIRWTPERPTDGEDVVFSADATDPDGEIVAWDWTLGDEATSSSSDAEHAFLHNKVYRISLTVRDDDGAESEPLSVDVEVANALPRAVFSFAATAPGTVTFSAHTAVDPSPHGRIVHIAWDFGDGTACPEAPSSCGSPDRLAPVHHFARPGAYHVTLVVIDDDGGIGRSTQTLTID